MNQRPSRSTLFPYTTLFRSILAPQAEISGIQLLQPLGGAAWLDTFHRKVFIIVLFHHHPHIANVYQAFILDRKSTRLNSSHGYISYAVFCLKKKSIKNLDAP